MRINNKLEWRPKTLCANCSASAMRLSVEGDLFVYCGEFGPMGCIVPKPIVECTMFKEKGSMDRMQAIQMGTVIELPPNRRNAGFQKKKESESPLDDYLK